MSYDNERLIMLKQRADRKEFLTEELRRLNKHRYEVRTGVLQLKRDVEKEQQDVEDLKKPGLSSLFYNLTGKFEKKLDKEYSEFQEADDKYNIAAQELSAIEYELERSEQEFRELNDIENEYKEAFDEKVKLIIALETPEADKVWSLDDDVKVLSNELKKMEEIMQTGRDVVSAAKHILIMIEKAEEHEARARYSDNSFSSTYARVEARELYDRADEYTSVLNDRLSLFRNKLIDISGFAKKYGDINIFSRFWDDNYNGTSDPEILLRQINPVLNRLDRVYESIEEKYTEVYGEYEDSVLKFIL